MDEEEERYLLSPKGRLHLSCEINQVGIIVRRGGYPSGPSTFIDIHSFGLCLNNRQNPYEDEAGWALAVLAR
jgi:hypothetical protein